MQRIRAFLASLTFTSVLAGVILAGWSTAAALMMITEIFGSNPGDQFGKTVACSSATAVIGAPNFSFNANPNSGSAFVFDNNTSTTTPLVYPPAPTSGAGIVGASMGSSVVFLDDVSNDFVPEVAVGLPGYGDAGAVAIYYDKSSVPSVFLNGSTFGERFGTSLASIFAFVNFGTPYLAVGAPMSSLTGGRVSIFDGVGMFAETSLVPPMADGATQFGATVANAGDVDLDGRSDIAISAQRSSIRSVYIYKFNGSAFVTVARLDNATGLQFGTSIADVGDVNGDNVDDILIGAPPLTAGTGHAYLYSGADLASGGQTLLCDLSGPANGDGFGTAVGSVGSNDANEVEFMVSAPRLNNGGGGVIAYVYRSGACVGIDRITSTLSGDGLGVSLSTAARGSCVFHPGEFNDLLIGTQSDLKGLDSGSVRVFQTEILPPTPTSTPTPTPVLTSARLTFRLDRNGNFSMHNTYNAQPPANCELILYERVVVNRKRAAVHEIGRVKSPDRIAEFTLRGLPKASIEDDAVPEVHMVTVTSCGGTQLQSNVFARFLNCGIGTGVSSATWSRQFRSKFRRKY